MCTKQNRIWCLVSFSSAPCVGQHLLLWGGSGGRIQALMGQTQPSKPMGIAHRAGECLSDHSERGNTVTYSLGITARDFSEKS